MLDARSFRKKNRIKKISLLLTTEEQQRLIEQWKKDYSFLPLSSYIRLKLFTQ